MSTSRHEPEFDWLISRRQLTRAIRLQALGAGVISRVDAKAPVRRDPAPADIIPAIERALDQACGGTFLPLPERALHLESFERVEVTRLDLLQPDAGERTSSRLVGRAVLEVSSERCGPFDFAIDDQVVTLDDASLAPVLAMVGRIGAETAEPPVADAA